MKSKNIKIKHRKYNLYNKKKSKGQQALTIILTIVIVLALAVIGFGLGRPLMDYFQNKNNNSGNSGSAWTPPVSESTPSTEQAETSSSTAETSDAESVEPNTPATENSSEVTVLPTSALRSMETLKAALSSAKSEGSTAVMLTLKNSSGNFLYKSDVAGIKDSEAITGKLTAKEIADAVIAAGMRPEARISTLRDPVSGIYVADIKYMTSDGYSWLDAAPTNGGKSWLSPFSEKTAQYIADITTELTAVGFKKVVYADMVFPAFLNADDAYLGHLPIRDDKARLDALWSVISAGSAAAKANGAEVLLEVNASDFEAAVKLSTTAEPTADRAKLAEIKLLLKLSADSSDYVGAKAVIGRMNGAYNGQSYSVMTDSSLPDAAKADVMKAFHEAEVTVYSE